MGATATTVVVADGVGCHCHYRCGSCWVRVPPPGGSAEWCWGLGVRVRVSRSGCRGLGVGVWVSGSGCPSPWKRATSRSGCPPLPGRARRGQPDRMRAGVRVGTKRAAWGWVGSYSLSACRSVHRRSMSWCCDHLWNCSVGWGDVASTLRVRLASGVGVVARMGGEGT